MPTLFALGAIWGGSFLFIKVIVDETGPLEVVFGRVLFGCLAVGAYVLVTRHRMVVTPSLVARVSVLAVLANILPVALISDIQCPSFFHLTCSRTTLAPDDNPMDPIEVKLDRLQQRHTRQESNRAWHPSE